MVQSVEIETYLRKHRNIQWSIFLSAISEFELVETAAMLKINPAAVLIKYRLKYFEELPLV